MLMINIFCNLKQKVAFLFGHTVLSFNICWVLIYFFHREHSVMLRIKSLYGWTCPLLSEEQPDIL